MSFLRRSVSFEYDADAWDVKSSKRAPGISCGQRFLRSSVIEDGWNFTVCKTRMSLSPRRHPVLPEGFARSPLVRREQLLLSCPYQRPFSSSAVGLHPRKMRLLRTMPAWVHPGMPTLSLFLLLCARPPFVASPTSLFPATLPSEVRISGMHTLTLFSCFAISRN